jgi:hypothetical protein
MGKPISNVLINKNLLDAFPIQDGLKQEDALLPLLSKFAFRVCHQEGPRKLGRIRIEWNTCTPGLC